ncbi:MAG TPA: hypothetical protein PK953_09570, partial [Smithellaceae bacterium]|nr:hypothetical protein [Smithellaceae bacterium]HQC11147.1 hypothetical protein [Smithellaceae bacterium]HQJ78124.1 hypothetical protein [Smithellaceae bacterium]HQN67700.1 hypothetical protein [Smithellaceae bacterium]HQP06806.1 hypothetical protein [Smithellaceae bacterium]
DVLAKDRDIDVKIEKIDREHKKISLGLADNEDEKSGSREESGDDYKGYLPRSPKTMGTLGDLMKKKK